MRFPRRLALAWAVLLTGLVATACVHRPMVPFTLDAVPQILTPATSAGVIDHRARFREIWCAVRNDHGTTLPDDRPCEAALLRLPGEDVASARPVPMGRPREGFRIVVVPGLYADCVRSLATPFSDALVHLETHGYRTGMIWVSGRSSSQANGVQIRDAIRPLGLDPGERLILVSHSKGAVDVLQAVVDHPEVVPHIAAVVSVAGAINGSPLADGIPSFFVSLQKHLPMPSCDRGDGGGLESLRRQERLAFLARATLPSSIRYFSVVGIVDRTETSRLLRPFYRRLAKLEPRNDGQVLWTDAVIPGSTLLGYVGADHWAIAMPFSRTSPFLTSTFLDKNAFPREVLLESIVRAVEEVL